VFSSTYDAYNIQITDLVNGTANDRAFSLRYLSGSTANSSSNYYNPRYIITNQTLTTNLQAVTTSGYLTTISANTCPATINIELMNPYNPYTTACQFTAVGRNNAGNGLMTNGWVWFNANNVFDGIQFLGTTDNLTANVAIYGYKS
jgi:hypothetical protein